jgi:hypothetical protein
VCCLWKYCLCALIKQTPFFGVLLVLLLECIDQENTQSCVCCWCYCYWSSKHQSFGVLLVVLIIFVCIDQANINLGCVVGVIVCVCIDQPNINLVCVVGVIVCVCIDQPNTNLVCVVGVNCLCALITANSNLASCYLCASSSGCVPIQCLCKDCLCASSGKQTANFVCCLCAWLRKLK